jgi:hypothetical protein
VCAKCVRGVYKVCARCVQGERCKEVKKRANKHHHGAINTLEKKVPHSPKDQEHRQRVRVRVKERAECARCVRGVCKMCARCV